MLSARTMKEVVYWSPKKVADWLLENAMPEYCEPLEHFTGQDLINLTQEDFKKPPLYRVSSDNGQRLLDMIETLKMEHHMEAHKNGHANGHLSIGVDIPNPDGSFSIKTKPNGMPNGFRKEMIKIPMPEPERSQYPMEWGKTFLAFLYALSCFVLTTVMISVVHERVPPKEVQPPSDKYEALREEVSPSPLSSSTVEGAQHPPAAATKYDVFKQLSLEGAGLAMEEFKENTSSTKSEDDFADFHSSKFSSTSSDKSLGEKAVAFRHAKEDSSSVKSLDLPSIGGSSVGKEDSEDALSVQFDMKLADVGGDLKHVMSDSSLDLPTVSGQHPPAADTEDLSCAAFGSCSSHFTVSTLTSCEWSDRADALQGRKLSPFVLSAGSRSFSATSNLHTKEISFGSSENITMSSLSKGSALASEDALPETAFPAFASFKDMMPQTTEQKDFESGDFQDFTRQDMPTVDRSQETSCPSPASSVASHETPKEGADDFGEFQSEKSKISKFDFLVANSQSKMKSSEEMIKSELATFDLSVQGSHKRSLSLGDKEISRSSPSPALEQPFRDRSNTLSERAALPVIRDKYKDLTGEVEENERYAYEWQRCLGSALDVIKKANDTLNGISSSAVCTEVIQSAQGMEYLLGVVEVYRVTKRVELGIKATAVCSEKLQQLLKDIDKVWNNLIGFMSLATLTPDENSLDFSSCMLRPGIKNAQELACGVCLLNVDSRSRKEETPAEEQPKKAFNSETDSFKLAYGGHQYHASCANFWINCVEPKPPGLLLPDLL